MKTAKIARDLFVVGGGCFGSQYVKWLLRASEKGMLHYRKIFAIDRDPHCQLKNTTLPDSVELIAADWVDYFTDYLATHFRDTEFADDFWVPSPLSPHILFFGMMRAAERLGVPCRFQAAGFNEPVLPPVRIPLANGDLAVSFAEWQCPVNCIEPGNCPAIHDRRTWDMKIALDGYFENQAARRGAHVLQCRHWVHGVGTIPMREIFQEFERFLENCRRPEIEDLVVATTSRCHGLISRAEILR